MDSETRDADALATPSLDPGTPTVAGGSPAASRDPSPELKPGDPVDRYSILGLLGSGGMGRVYAAYDPRLDRKIALKLLRTAGAGSRRLEARLLREAQALAQVSHPNVLTVYDVGTYGSRVFLAAECVEGTHLGQWLRDKKPDRQQILDVFLQAGRGLAAAHRHGLVHRDFKPGNVMVRADDQRALVLDFGLARSAHAGDESDANELLDSPRQLHQQLTQAGSVMGTPAFMAPEQWQGTTSAAGDQFSFCASLYTALCGRLPFDPEHPLTERYLQAPAVDDGSEVPNWLRKVLLRGLSLDPADRFPSMDALLRALADDPQKRRRRRLGLAAAGLAVVGITLAWPRGTTPCEAGEPLMAEVWNPARRSHLTSTLNAASPYGQSQAGTVARLLDDYADNWRRDYLDACEATHIRGDQSVALLDRRMACLQLRRRELSSLVDLMSSQEHARQEKRDLGRWMKAAQDLSSLAECSDTAALMSPQHPPADPETRQQVEDLRGRIAENNALMNAGNWAEALAEAKTLVTEAEQLAHLPTLAEALLRLGLAQEKLSKGEEAGATFERAISVAQAGRHDRVGAEAFTRLVRINAHLLRNFDQSDFYARLAKGNIQRLDRPEDLQADLADHIGVLESRRGDLERALQFHLEALELNQARLGKMHPSVATSLIRLGTVSHDLGQFQQAASYLQEALLIQKESLGSEHPAVATTLDRLGNVSYRQGELADADRYYRQALEILLTTHGPEHALTATIQLHSATVLSDLGQHLRALEHFQQVLEVFVDEYGPEHPNVAAVWSNIGTTRIDALDFDGALDAYAQTLRIQRQTLGQDHLALATTYFNMGEAWNEKADFHRAMEHHQQALDAWRRHLGESHYLVGHALTGLGRAQLGLDRPSEALANFEQALKLWQDQEQDAAVPAWTRWQMAQAVSHEDSEKARDLAQQALDGYRRSAADHPNEIQQIERFLSESGTDGP